MEVEILNYFMRREKKERVRKIEIRRQINRETDTDRDKGPFK
jgi:hypothetical protein